MLVKFVVFTLCAQISFAAFVQNGIRQEHVKAIRENPYKPIIPKECLNQSYCHIKSKHYPQKLMDTYIKIYNLTTNDSILMNVSDDVPGDQLPEPRIRLGNDSKHSTIHKMCKENTMDDPIFIAKATDGEYNYIVQGKNYNQNVEMRRCDSPSASCSGFAEPQPRAKCREVQKEYSLKAISSQRTMETKNFLLSVGCRCTCLNE